MPLQFQIFPNYLFMQLQFFFLPELILHKYSVEGYVRSVELVPAPCGVRQDDVLDWQYQAAYRSLLGALAWSGSRTRSDLSYKASRLAHHSRRATMQNLQELNRLAKRSFGHSAARTCFRPIPRGSPLWLLAVSDASWGREVENRSQGGCFLLVAEDVDSPHGRDVACVLLAWRSWTLKRVAVGTLDAEVPGGTRVRERCSPRAARPELDECGMPSNLATSITTTSAS